MNNFLHLDFKGICPSLPRLFDWLNYFKSLGFNGIVAEYDCRVAWQCWPGAGSPYYSSDDIRQIAEYTKSIGLELVPLIQSIGHLEWLLRHERYAELRENGQFNEICPNHPDALPHIQAWLNEAIELHPHSRVIHLGADETWNLGTCPQCLKKLNPQNPLAQYIRHVDTLCRYALKRGLRPMIWADMFWRKNQFGAAALLPPETILINWQYRGGLPFPHTEELKQSGREVWGASALQCSAPGYGASCLADSAARIENIQAWHITGLNLIHTTWGRPSNFTPLYPPWHSLVPPLLAAGTGKAFMSSIPQNDFELQYHRWVALAQTYDNLKQRFHQLEDCRKSFNIVTLAQGVPSKSTDKNFRESRETLYQELDVWSGQVRNFFRDNQLFEVEEFISSRTALFF